MPTVNWCLSAELFEHFRSLNRIVSSRAWKTTCVELGLSTDPSQAISRFAHRNVDGELVDLELSHRIGSLAGSHDDGL